MYNTAVLNTSISTGVPAAILAVTGTRQWGVVAGVTLVMVGLVNLLLIVRSGRQLEREFTGV